MTAVADSVCFCVLRYLIFIWIDPSKELIHLSVCLRLIGLFSAIDLKSALVLMSSLGICPADHIAV